MENGDHNGRIDSDRGVKILVLTAAGIFLAALVASVFILRPSKSRIAEVVQDDAVLYTFDLGSAKDQTVVVSYPGGSSNTITIQNGQIWVSDAECPDHTCMKMGKLRSESLPIVCLPNHLVIRFAD